MRKRGCKTTAKLSGERRNEGIFIKMLNFLSFLDQSELMENDLHYNV